MITRYTGIIIGLLNMFGALAQGGDVQVRTKADALFKEERFAEAMPLYSQLISLDPANHQLNFHYGTCVLFGGSDKEKAVGYLKYSVSGPSTTPAAWYWLGRAYHLNYRFKLAIEAYEKFQTTADKKELAARPVDALIKQCQNGSKLLSNLKEIDVRKKVEVDENDFFRFYDLNDIGGRIVVMPEELKSNLDKKQKGRALIYLPDGNGPIYFSSYGKDGKTGKDIYRTEVLPNGSFATPVKIPGYINTDQDEDFPFLHPDGKTFYFSSKGHNSMGGYDVFKATYDRRSDTFGRPENLDFAVNTPDDDFLYIVDPEHKEACFASARTSKQGKLHVYRVSTSQIPLVITVLQGNYGSTIDASDKKARIVVEDAVSRELITEVRTEKDGSYVLALPRSGRFRFLVECGPSGKTHVGIVDIPRNDGPKAYGQELELTRSADQEKLMIRNFFDQPLDGDLIALALDEIKRRANLDVTERPTSAAKEEEHFDVLTRAGFTGQYDEATVVRMAEEDAHQLEAKATDLDVQAREAFALAIEAVAVGEQLAKQAEEVAAQAMLISNEEERYRKMVEAARLRDDSQVATSKARIAHRTARDLEAEQLAMKQRAITAAKLAVDIRTNLEKENEKEAVRHLATFKERLDQKARPDQDPDPVLRAERAMLAKEKESKTALQQARNSRIDENDLAERITKLEREKLSTKNSKRAGEIDGELIRYRADIVPLQKETEARFKTAREQEKELFILRGDHTLKKHLATIQVTEPRQLGAKDLDGLADRIASTTSKIEAMHVDERFVAHVPEREEERSARIFEWGGQTLIAASTERVATQAAPRSTSDEALRAGSRTSPVAGSDLEGTTPREADITSAPVSSEGEEKQRLGAGQGSTAAQGTERTGEPAGGTRIAGSIDGPSEQQPDEQHTIGTGTESGIAEQRDIEETSPATGSDVAKAEGAGGARTFDLTPEQVRMSEDPQQALPRNTGHQAIDAATERFLIENELAEIDQLLQAEKSAARRDSLKARKGEIEVELHTVDALAAKAVAELEAATDEDMWETVDLERVPMIFNRDTKEEVLIGKLFAEYYDHRASLEKMADADERAAGLYGLELMLSDSLRSEMARQLMVLELDPQQAERILPRVERLRQIRESHIRQGEQYLQARQDELAAIGASEDDEEAEEDEALAPIRYSRSAELAPAHPVKDRFVHIHDDPYMIYYSEIHHRSPDVAEGVARKEMDLARMDVLSQKIDSSLNELSTIRRGKEYDRVRKTTDRLIDESLIIRTELGQRSAYLTKEEWRTANDSVRTLQREITVLGFSPSEPVLLMAKDMRNEALKTFDKAGQTRKAADRTPDIIVRDSLYRKAYAQELEALRELDRSITVQNYLVSGSHVRGENITYEELAVKVLSLDPPLAASERSVIPGKGATTMEEEVIATRDAGTQSATQEPATSGQQMDREQDQVAESTGRNAGENDAAAKLTAAREQAEQLIKELEEKQPAEARKAPHSYERLLAEEPATIDPRKIQPVEDPELMRKLVVSTLEEAVALERKSEVMAERVKFIKDSASTLKKRDREVAESLAVRTQVLADSLRSAAILKGQEAREHEVQERNALQNDMLYRRLVKYYYLDAEEMSLVMQDHDRSKYFQSMARALEQYDAAREAESAAKLDRELGQTLHAQALRAEEEARQGRLSAVEAAEHARILDTRAEMLKTRADSLVDVADRLKKAAVSMEQQAGGVVKRMDGTDSSTLMALELGSRRTGTPQDEVKAQARKAERIQEEQRVQEAQRVKEEQRMQEERRLSEEQRIQEEQLAATKAAPTTTAEPESPVQSVEGAPTVDRKEVPQAPTVPEVAQQEPTPSIPEVAQKERSVTVPAVPDIAPPSIADQTTEPAAGTTPANRNEQAGATPVADKPTTAAIRAPSPVVNEATAPERERVLPEPTPVGEGVFTMPRQLVGDIFELRAPGEKRAQPIIMNEALPEGIIYKVQIGAFRNQIPTETFSDMTPVMGEDAGNGLTRYTAGLFSSFDQAFSAKDKVRDRGYRDAFVVAYLNGQRIPLGEAMRVSRSGDVAASDPNRNATSTPGQGQEQLAQTPRIPSEPVRGPVREPVSPSDRTERPAEQVRTVPTPGEGTSIEPVTGGRDRTERGTAGTVQSDPSPAERTLTEPSRVEPSVGEHRDQVAQVQEAERGSTTAPAATPDQALDQAHEQGEVLEQGRTREPADAPRTAQGIAGKDMTQERQPRSAEPERAGTLVVPGQDAQSPGPVVPAPDVDATIAQAVPVEPLAPVAVVPVSAEEEAKQILEKYPQTPEAIIAQFSPAPSAVDYYPVTGAAPARPVEMIMGLFFTVQVGVYTKPVALDKLYNITPLVSELTETEKIRYSTGVFTDMEKARERRLQIVDMGVKDAFVTAYLNGKRIPIRDANTLLEEHGPGILAKP